MTRETPETGGGLLHVRHSHGSLDETPNETETDFRVTTKKGNETNEIALNKRESIEDAMSKKKVSKSSRANAAVASLLKSLHERGLWLSNTLRDLANQFNTFRDETRLKVGTILFRIANLETRTTLEFERALADVVTLQTAVGKLIEQDDHAWKLAESRNSVYRKADDDLISALQRFNERLSKTESDLYFAKIANVDNVKVINWHADRLKIVEGQTGMLGECLVSHNARVARLEEHEDYPSAVDQDTVDSKLSGLYYRIAALEKRIREASAPVNQQSTPRTITAAEALRNVHL